MMSSFLAGFEHNVCEYDGKACVATRRRLNARKTRTRWSTHAAAKSLPVLISSL
jgi:hypothetical protein